VADLIKELRASRKTCEEGVVWQLLIQAGSGLCAIHAQRVIHRCTLNPNLQTPHSKPETLHNKTTHNKK